MAKSKTLRAFKEELLVDDEVRRTYEDVAPKHAIAWTVIKARLARGLTQAELAERMQTSQSFIARLESGTVMPSMKTLFRVAEATGTRPRFELDAD